MQVPIEEANLPEKVKKLLKKRGISWLWEWQKRFFDEVGVDKSAIVSVPTGAGKTVVAEGVALSKVIDGGKVVYVAPLRSLAIEKYLMFKQYEKLGIGVGVSTGDFSSRGTELKEKDIVVTTFEKLDSLLRHRASWLDDVSLVVVDEIHSIGDVERGATLENILMWAKYRQVLGLSATVRNIRELADWLGAYVFVDNFRPVKLKVGAFANGKVYWEDGSVETSASSWKGFVVSRVNDGRNVLVFVSRRNMAEKYASDIASALDVVIEIGDEVTDEVEERLGDIVYKGVAFHHGGLSSSIRSWVERLFRERLLRVVVATPTLAMGVNLPADVVVIKDLYRWNGKELSKLSRVEFWQMAGRAGRPFMSNYGEVVVVLKKKNDVEKFFNEYVEEEIEYVRSKLVMSKRFISQVLALFAIFDYRSIDDVVEHYKESFFYKQVGDDSILRNYITRAVDWLLQHGFLEESLVGYYDYEEISEISVSELGRRVAELYILPHTALEFMEVFDNVAKRFDVLGILSRIVTCSDFDGVSSKKDFVTSDFDFVSDLILKSYTSLREDEINDVALNVRIVLDWISGLEIDDISKVYGVGKGDISRVIEYVEWLTYAFAELYKVVVGEDEVYGKLRDLHLQVKYGVPKHLVDLVKVRGIGRRLAFRLWESGIRSIDDLAKNPELARRFGIKKGTFKSLERWLKR